MKRLGDAELEIMLAVWNAGEAVTSVYVCEKLRPSRNWALPAVVTSLNRLVDKGFLACEKQGRSNLYGGCWTDCSAAASRAWWPRCTTGRASGKRTWTICGTTWTNWRGNKWMCFCVC